MPERQRRQMELNEALRDVGDLGRFQYLIFACLFIVGIFHGSRMTSGYFFLYDQGHRCAPINSSDDQLQYNTLWTARNGTKPSDESCYIYNTTDQDYSGVNDGNSTLIPCPNGWVYDKSVMKWTATAEYNLVCDKKVYPSHANAALMLGCLVGAVIFGKVSDRFGRQVCFHSAVLVFVAFGVGMVWASNFYIFAVCYAITGAASTGLYTSSVVTAIELVLPEHRKIPGMLINTFFPLGEAIMTGLAYGFRDWRWICITLSAPAALLFSYYWIVPESLRWLMLHKKYQKLQDILQRMARINGRDSQLQRHDDEDFAALLQSYEEEEQEEQRDQNRDSFFHMFKYCVLTQRICIISINWFVVNLAYFGLVYNSTDLGQGIFMNFFLGAIVEAPAHILSVLLVDRIGRRNVHCFYLALIMVASAVSIIVCLKLEDVKWILLLMTMVGKFGAAGAMGTSYFWMTELYPTSIRSTGLGIGAGCARVGGVLSSYVIEFSQQMNSSLGNAVPYIVFCGITAVTCVLCFFLPETSGRVLPATIEEARHFGRNPERQPVLQDKEENRAYGAQGYRRLQQ